MLLESDPASPFVTDSREFGASPAQMWDLFNDHLGLQKGYTPDNPKYFPVYKKDIDSLQAKRPHARFGYYIGNDWHSGQAENLERVTAFSTRYPWSIVSGTAAHLFLLRRALPVGSITLRSPEGEKISNSALLFAGAVVVEDTKEGPKRSTIRLCHTLNGDTRPGVFFSVGDLHLPFSSVVSDLYGRDYKALTLGHPRFFTDKDNQQIMTAIIKASSSRTPRVAAA